MRVLLWHGAARQLLALKGSKYAKKKNLPPYSALTSVGGGNNSRRGWRSPNAN